MAFVTLKPEHVEVKLRLRSVAHRRGLHEQESATKTVIIISLGAFRNRSKLVKHRFEPPAVNTNMFCMIFPMSFFLGRVGNHQRLP